MKGIKTTIYTKCEGMPELLKGSYFHSRELMETCQVTPRQRAYMVVVTDDDGHELSHMLGIVRIRTLLLPPFLLIHCRILGEGVYADETRKDELLGKMLATLTQKLDNRVLFIEVSNMSQIYWGQIYVVQLDDFRLVKYLRRHTDPNMVVLRSENPNYDDMDVRRSDIHELLLVQHILHINSRL